MAETSENRVVDWILRHAGIALVISAFVIVGLSALAAFLHLPLGILPPHP